MRRPVTVLLGGCVLAAVVVLVLALTTREREAFTLGVPLSGPAVGLAPGVETCQAPIRLPDAESDFDRVAFVLSGKEGTKGPPLAVTLETEDGKSVGRGRLENYTLNPKLPAVVDVGHVTTREPMTVCLRNAGRTEVALYGSGDLASRTSTATLNGTPLGVDVALSFEHAEPRSALSLLPTVFDRMALWRTGWAGGWLYWVLGALLALAVPALLVYALREVTTD